MKRSILILAFVIVSGMTNSVMAADGTIHFTGSISDQTCTVESNSQSLNVDLGQVAQAALNGAAGIKASPSSFTLILSECPDTVAGASVKFDGTPDELNKNLLALDDDTGVATGVGIEIANSDGTAIPLHSASADYPLTEGSNTLGFLARYVSTGAAVTPGKANGTSEFTINYK